MNNINDEYRWYLLEQRLGTVKTAQLRWQPLDALVIKHAEATLGVHLGDSLGVAEAAALLGKRASMVRSERDAIQQMIGQIKRAEEEEEEKAEVIRSDTDEEDTEHSLEECRAAVEAQETKEAAAAMPWSTMTIMEKIAYSKMLSDFRVESAGTKYAATAGDMYTLVNHAIYDSLTKQSNFATDAAKKVMTGGLIGTGMAIPGYMAAEAVTDNAQDKALQTAMGATAMGVLGAGALGAGALGVNALMDQRGTKSASLGRDTTALEELQATLYLDSHLKSAAYTEKTAALIEFNQAYGVSILYRIVE